MYARLQAGEYVFTMQGVAISWLSKKQQTVALSSNVISRRSLYWISLKYLHHDLFIPKCIYYNKLVKFKLICSQRHLSYVFRIYLLKLPSNAANVIEEFVIAPNLIDVYLWFISSLRLRKVCNSKAFCIIKQIWDFMIIILGYSRNSEKCQVHLIFVGV